LRLHLQQQCFQNKQVFKTWTGRNYYIHSHTQYPSAKVTKLQHNFEGLAKTKAQACFMQLGFSLSNQQKVQLNTYLILRHTQEYLYTKRNGQLKLNEIEKGLDFQKGDRIIREI